MAKRYKADVKIMVTVYFEDDEITDPKTQAADAVQDGDFHDVEILDIYDVEETGHKP